MRRISFSNLINQIEIKNDWTCVDSFYFSVKNDFYEHPKNQNYNIHSERFSDE